MCPVRSVTYVSGRSLVCADDRFAIRHTVRRTAESAKQALEVMDQWQPDVLVADIGMPDVDGYEFIRRVRARNQQSGGAVPAAALTAYARTQDRLRVLSEGYQMHVPKPIQPAKLVTVVASLAKRLG